MTAVVQRALASRELNYEVINALDTVQCRYVESRTER